MAAFLAHHGQQQLYLCGLGRFDSSTAKALVGLSHQHASAVAQELALVARSNLVLSSLDPALYAQFTKCYDLFRRTAMRMDAFNTSASYVKSAWLDRNLYSIEGE